MKNFRVLFINPMLREKTKILPVGLAYVMTYVKQQGIDFELFDIDIHSYDDDFVENYIKENEFDVILFGSIVTHYKWVKWLTKTIKKHHPKTWVAVGNSVAGSCLEVFLNNAPADFVIYGEGEITTAELLFKLRDGSGAHSIEGLAYRKSNGEIVKNPKRKACKIDTLPIPDWSMFDVESYKKYDTGNYYGAQGAGDKPVPFPIATARGCAFRCTFCHFVYWDDPYRFRSPQNILQEIDYLESEYGANHFNFWDDLSFASIPQVERMADAILETGKKFDWTAAIRTDLFGKEKVPYHRKVEVAKKMKESGCDAVGFSLESANAEILKMMNKKVNPEYFNEQIEILKDVGITSNISVVFGYPIETAATIKETFDMCLENKVYPSIGFLLPLPYTGMYEYAKKHGFIVDEDAYLESITERQDICLNMTSMSDEEIMNSIKDGAGKLNEMLKLGLNEDTYIKTGGYDKHTNSEEHLKSEKKILDPENIERNENDFSFNYSNTEFEMDYGKKKKAEVCS